MDAVIQDMIIGLAINGFTGILNFITMKRIDSKTELIKNEGLLSDFLRKEIVDSSQNRENIDITILQNNNLKLFLGTSEAESIIRQIYANLLLKNDDFDLIYDEFILSYSIIVKDENKNSDNVKKEIFELLVESCKQTKKLAIVKDIIKPDALSFQLIHYNRLYGEIKNIQRNLDYLNDSKTLSIDEVLEFEKKYRNQVEYRHKKIIPPNFYGSKKLPIEDIYVNPTFTQKITKISEYNDFQSYYSNLKKDPIKENDFKEIMNATFNYNLDLKYDLGSFKGLKHNIDDLNFNSNTFKLDTDFQYFKKEPHFNVEDILASMHRIVILGHPGAGKSTFSLKICQELTKNYTKKPFAGRSVTPILVVLREYAAKKKEKDISILEFIELTSKSLYQLNPPNGAFEYLLLNGRVMVIFDGLDELLDTKYRNEISGDIESFCHLYPSVPVIVTSREVGYNQAPLDQDQFEIYHLKDFNEDQVEEYVNKWFNSDEDLTMEEKRQKSRKFLKESINVQDLRSNPLMLALMCNLYKGANYIPRHRTDVYKKCAEMLFYNWDMTRQIKVPLKYDSSIEPALMYLSNWIYTDNSLQSGVTESKLIKKTAEYLHSKRYEDLDEANQAAKDFITYCKGRAWVFTDMGSDRYGESLYQFTHRTFLEFFAAAHIVRNNHSPEKLSKLLLPKIHKREWDIVAQLSFQRLDREVEGASDELLLELINKFRNSTDKDKWNYLSFAVRCLEFMIPSTKTTRIITTEYVTSCIDLVTNNPKKYQEVKNVLKHFSLNYESSPLALLSFFLRADSENIRTIVRSFESCLKHYISNGTDLESELAVEIGFHAENSALLTSDYDKFKEEVLLVSNKIKKTIVKWESIRLYCPNNLILCLSLLKEGEINLKELVEWHGIKSLFKVYPYKMYPTFGQRSRAFELFTFALFGMKPQDKDNIKELTKELEDLADIFINTEMPFIPNEKDYDDFDVRIEVYNNKKEEKVDLNSNALFGLFGIVAIFLEIYANTKDIQRELRFFQKIDHPNFNGINPAFIARYDSSNLDPINKLKSIGFSSLQMEIILDWTYETTNFVYNI